jgi:hypothetical protein
MQSDAFQRNVKIEGSIAKWQSSLKKTVNYRTEWLKLSDFPW